MQREFFTCRLPSGVTAVERQVDGKFKLFLLPSKTPARERFAWVHAELRDAAGENREGGTRLTQHLASGTRERGLASSSLDGNASLTQNCQEMRLPERTQAVMRSLTLPSVAEHFKWSFLSP